MTKETRALALILAEKHEVKTVDKESAKALCEWLFVNNYMFTIEHLGEYTKIKIIA